MAIYEIPSRIDGHALFSLETKSIKLCGEAAVKSGADLSHADLSHADLDYSSGFSFCCSSFGAKIDLRIAAQLAYHFCRMDCDDPEFLAAKESLKELANKFHRIKECREI
jgi:hypothetical protein